MSESRNSINLIELTQDEFEKIMDPTDIKYERIVNFMDDNLSIDLIDLQRSFESVKFTISKEQLIQLVLNSNSYYYDQQRNLVKLKYKCQRRTIVFPTYEFINETNFENEIKELFEKFNSGDKIKSIEKTSSKIIFVTFENEEVTFEVYKKFENFKFSNNLSISASIKSENLKRKLLEKFETNEKPILPQIYKNILQSNKGRGSSFIISDQINYAPRRIIEEDSKIKKEDDLKNFNPSIKTIYDAKKASITASEISINDLEAKIATNPIPVNQNKRVSINKFDLPKQEEQPRPKLSVFNKFHVEKTEFLGNVDTSNTRKNMSFRVPLNKDYRLSFEGDPLISKLEEFVNMTVEEREIKHKYKFMEIALIFFNLNLNKKFEKPECLVKNFIPEVMLENPRVILDHYKDKTMKIGRERAQTFFQTKRNSSISKFRNSQFEKQTKEIKEEMHQNKRNRITSVIDTFNK